MTEEGLGVKPAVREKSKLRFLYTEEGLLAEITPEKAHAETPEGDVTMSKTRGEELELVHGSGNVFRDFDDPQADILQLKSILAARIIGILDDRNLSVRKAQQLTGVAASEFSRVRNAKLTRFTVDRLMALLNKLDQEVEVTVTIRPRTHTHHHVSV